jgi:hypothetical protein
MTNTVSLSRADLYDHGRCSGECDGPDPQSLGLGVLDVLLIGDGSITIAARVAPPEKGGNYIEIDLLPADARRLAHLILAASDDADERKQRLN